MSADNTIGILITRRRDGQEGNEYRVAHVQAVENIEMNPDYPSADHPVLHRENVRRLVGRSSFFYSIEEANRTAELMEGCAGFVEHGIRVLDFASVFFPASDRKRRQRLHRRRGKQAHPPC
jgi:hypothetical protein